jgi:hypothetical protein
MITLSIVAWILAFFPSFIALQCWDRLHRGDSLDAFDVFLNLLIASMPVANIIIPIALWLL